MDEGDRRALSARDHILVVTANHYWLDAVGGAVALSIGYGLGVGITDAIARRRRVLRPVGVPPSRVVDRQNNE